MGLSFRVKLDKKLVATNIFYFDIYVRFKNQIISSCEREQKIKMSEQPIEWSYSDILKIWKNI